MTGPAQMRARAMLAARVLIALAVFWTALTVALAAVPGMPGWPLVVTAALALVAACGAGAAIAAWLMEAPEPRPQLPPVPRPQRYASRDWSAMPPRDFLTLQMPPARPAGGRPAPGAYECPVRPGWPRTAADLRDWPPPRRRDLRSWE